METLAHKPGLTTLGRYATRFSPRVSTHPITPPTSALHATRDRCAGLQTRILSTTTCARRAADAGHGAPSARSA